MPEVSKMIRGHQGTYTNTFGGVLNTFGIFDFFHLYHFFPLHPLFGPFWPFLVPRTESLVRHRAIFSLGPITFDRIFKKKFRGYQQNPGFLPRILSYISTFFEHPIKNPDFLTLGHKKGGLKWTYMCLSL